MDVEHRLQNDYDHTWEHISPSGARITVFIGNGASSFLISTGDERINRAMSVRKELLAPLIASLQAMEVFLDAES